MKNLNLLLMGLILASVFNAYSQGEKNMGEAIQNQSVNNQGTFDFPGITCKLLGVAYLSNESYPDLFLLSDNRYPGNYYYKYEEFSDQGIPVFSEAKEFTAPFSFETPGCMLQEKNKIYGFYYDEGKVILTVFDKKAFSFTGKANMEISLPRKPDAMHVVREESGDLLFVFSISDGKKTRAPGDWRSSEYIPYSPEGVYNGEVSYSDLYSVRIDKDFKIVKNGLTKISKGDVKVRSGHQNITGVTFNQNTKGMITGSRFGNLYFYQLSGNGSIAEESMVVGEDLISLRHPTINATPTAYPGSTGKLTDLIVAGEGGIYYYKYLKFSDERNAPVYDSPKSLLKQNAQLKGGSLVVPTMVDWDGDGTIDIVSGNSMGQILFFKNRGDNKTPKFISGIPLSAGGKEIHIQPGYGEDIQGSGESRWGYTCPNVADWNDDGLYDIVMGDSRGKHTVYLNVGTKETPKLAHEHPIYLEGLELHGTWRCRPGVARIGDKMAYVTLDDEDEFRLYWQVDAYNLKEGFKLKLEDGSPIKGNFLEAGGTGRLKFNVLDWDLDGVLDLIVGTPRHGCIPDPVNGLPWNYSERQGPGAAVLFLKNVGSDTEPVYQFPKLIKYKGEPIFLGQHSCAPAPWYNSNTEGASLIIGRENGMFYFFDRRFLSW